MIDPSERRGFRFRRIYISAQQWQLIESLGPAWNSFKRGAFGRLTMVCLERNRWIEMKRYPDLGFNMLRLTPLGLEIRDSIYQRRAKESDSRRRGVGGTSARIRPL